MRKIELLAQTVHKEQCLKERADIFSMLSYSFPDSQINLLWILSNREIGKHGCKSLFAVGFFTSFTC
jgi:hypothetical protein